MRGGHSCGRRCDRGYRPDANPGWLSPHRRYRCHPVVPVGDGPLIECALMAREVATELWDRYSVPCYLYEAAASRPDRVLLEEVRRGQFEGLREAVLRDASRRPDMGGPGLHRPRARPRSAPAACLSSTTWCSTRATSVLHVQWPERCVRKAADCTACAPLPCWLAAAPRWHSASTNFRQTSVSAVHAAVSEAARKHRAPILHGELTGLIPEAAYEPESAWAAELLNFHAEERVLERRLAEPLAWPVAL